MTRLAALEAFASAVACGTYRTSLERVEAAEAALAVPMQASAQRAEALFLVCAGGDGYSSVIVPESKLDEAYLLTQWCTLDSSDADKHREALEHFHDPDEWTYLDPLRGGKDRVAVEFGINFEDGWVRVVRLPVAP